MLPPLGSGGSSLLIATLGKVVGVTRSRVNNPVADGVLPRAERGWFDLSAAVQAYRTGAVGEVAQGPMNSDIQRDASQCGEGANHGQV